jgi:hypothetical protein
MSSLAAQRFRFAMRSPEDLRQFARDRRLRPLQADQAQSLYHAALASGVAAWNAYLKGIVLEFFDAIAAPLVPASAALHGIARSAAEQIIGRLNTPNWDNSRNALVQGTGYDPYTDWQWTRRQMGVHQVQRYLNEILHVRHSFAHGFALPAYAWTLSPTGRARLTNRAVADVEALVRYLVAATDKGMKIYISQNFGVSVTW